MIGLIGWLLPYYVWRLKFGGCTFSIRCVKMVRRCRVRRYKMHTQQDNKTHNIVHRNEWKKLSDANVMRAHIIQIRSHYYSLFSPLFIWNSSANKGTPSPTLAAVARILSRGSSFSPESKDRKCFNSFTALVIRR